MTFVDPESRVSKRRGESFIVSVFRPVAVLLVLCVVFFFYVSLSSHDDIYDNICAAV